MVECIVNPSSRSGRGAQIWHDLKTRFRMAGIEYREHLTDGPGAALRFSREITSAAPADGEDIRLVVLGGDGTLNEAVSGIADFHNVLLGYIPTGSANDFARGAQLPTDYNKLIDRIVTGKQTCRIDVGELTYHNKTRTLSRLHDEPSGDTRRFVISAGIGFDAAVCEEALSSNTKSFLNRIGLGKLTYGAIAIRQLLRADKIGIHISMDQAREMKLDHFLFAALMILPYEGGGFKFAPDADGSDGVFNLCLVGDMTKPAMFRALLPAYFGKHYGIHGIYTYKTDNIRIKTELPMWVHTDGGGVMKSDDISLTCLKQVLRLMV